MLVLSRKKNESIVINDDTTIVVVEIRGDKVRLGVEAPKEVPVHRREVFDASHELVLRYSEPAIRRVRRRIELAACTRPGSYVIDLIGNGMSSRAVVHKVRLRHVMRVTKGTAEPICIADHWFLDGDEVVVTMSGVEGVGSKALNRLGEKS